MPSSRSLVVGVVAAAVLGAAVTALISGFGPLNPPAGPVSSTGRTLQDLEPRRPIRASDLPMTITQPGVYFLAEDINFTTLNTNAIAIGVYGVTIDLNGMTLRGPGWNAGNTGSGIVLTGTADGGVVKNGTITNFRLNGIDWSNSDGGNISDVQTIDNGLSGMKVGQNIGFRRCHSNANGQHGFEFASRCSFDDCVARVNIRFGFSGSIGLFDQCVAASNYEIGFSAEGSALTGCTSFGNLWAGFVLGNSSSAINCRAISNQLEGFATQDRCQLSGNLAHGNGTPFSRAGFYVQGANSVLDGNVAIANWRGIEVVAAGNIVVRCIARGNVGTGTAPAPDFIIAANNTLGEVRSGAGTITNSTGPWANLR